MNNLKFSELPEFQKDLKYFTQELSLVSNPALKEECNKLLKELASEAAQIDAGHDPANNGYIDPRSLHENRIRIIEIRKRLTTIVNDLKTA